MWPTRVGSQDADTHVQGCTSNFPATSAAQLPSSTTSVPTTDTLTYSNEQSPGAMTVSPDFQPIMDQLPRSSGHRHRPPANLRVLACTSHAASVDNNSPSSEQFVDNRFDCVDVELLETHSNLESSLSSSVNTVSSSGMKPRHHREDRCEKCRPNHDDDRDRDQEEHQWHPPLRRSSPACGNYCPRQCDECQKCGHRTRKYQSCKGLRDHCALSHGCSYEALGNVYTPMSPKQLEVAIARIRAGQQHRDRPPRGRGRGVNRIQAVINEHPSPGERVLSFSPPDATPSMGRGRFLWEKRERWATESPDRPRGTYPLPPLPSVLSVSSVPSAPPPSAAMPPSPLPLVQPEVNSTGLVGPSTRPRGTEPTAGPATFGGCWPTVTGVQPTIAGTRPPLSSHPSDVSFNDLDSDLGDINLVIETDAVKSLSGLIWLNLYIRTNLSDPYALHH